MTRPFLPPPDPERCCAAAWCGYYNARCPNRRAPGSDICQTHLELLATGRKITRVQRPAGKEVGR